jgi:predicted nucleotidyltransferase
MLNEAVLNEFEEIFDKVYPNQINLKSFERKQQLNSKIWVHNDMKRIIRKHLLAIAKNFIENLEMGIKIEDVVVVGSLAGYNWSKYSDIDLHIMVDFAALSNLGTPETLKDLFDMKKNNWNNNHNVLIYGYPVELYVQDVNEVNGTDGCYSVLFGKWNKIPQGKNTTFDRDLVKTLASQYINIIDNIGEYAEKLTSVKKCNTLLEIADKIYDEIIQGRRDSIAEFGEYGAHNIVFKVLRRTGHIGKLKDIKVLLSDKINSL